VFILIILSGVLNIVHHLGSYATGFQTLRSFFLGGKIVRSGKILVLLFIDPPERAGLT